MHTYACVCVLELLPTRVACQISKSGRRTVKVGGGRLLSCLPNVKSSNCAKLQKRVKKVIFILLKSVSTNLWILIENSVCERKRVQSVEELLLNYLSILIDWLQIYYSQYMVFMTLIESAENRRALSYIIMIIGINWLSNHICISLYTTQKTSERESTETRMALDVLLL